MNLSKLSVLASLVLFTFFLSSCSKDDPVNEGDTKIYDLSVTTTDGDTKKLEDVLSSDKHTLIKIWASWCGKCKNELQAWSPLASKWTSQHNLQIAAVSIDSESAKADAKTIYDGYNIGGQLVFSSSDEVKSKISFSSTPVVLLYDRNKKLVYQHRGFSSGDEKELDEIIRTKLK